ncbi:MAG TPA: SDR family NAD(P)-dependent oxidoreductase, partial [Roseiarcus sp.]
MQPDPALKWIVVTGASAGIGKALVERLAREGHNVIAAARDPTRANVPNGPGRVEVVRLDFDDPVGVETAARDITGIARAAGLAALVNMAGIIIEGPLEAIPTPALRRQFEVNVIGPVALTQALLPLLAKTRG